MSIVTPPGSNRKSSNNLPAQSFSTREKATLVVVGVWIVATTIAQSTYGAESVLFGIVSPLVGLIWGAYKGFFVGFDAIRQLFPWTLFIQIALSSILGALAGAFSAWLVRVLHFKNKFAKSFISSAFSPDIWGGNVAGFLSKLIIGAVVGYSVATGFASIGALDAGTSNLGVMAGAVLGNGGGSGLEHDFITWVLFFFATFVALLVAGGIIGGCVGGIVGAVVGAGLSSVSVNAVIQGAAEGVVFRFFSPYRPNYLRSSRLIYLVVGIGKGAGESIVVGIFVGMVLFVARLVGIAS